MKRLSLPLLVLIFIILIDLVLVVVYFERGSLSDLMSSVIPGPKISAVSEVKGVDFTIADEKRLEQTLDQLHFFDENGVVIINTTQRVTVKRVVFKFVRNSQLYNQIQDSNHSILSSVGQVFNSKSQTMEIDLYFSPSYQSAYTSDILSKAATGKTLAFVYQLTLGSSLTDLNTMVQRAGSFSRGVLDKGVVFKIQKK